MLRSIEVCAGAGGLALGLERSGFRHQALVEIDSQAGETLRLNRPAWNVVEQDVHDFDPTPYGQIDLLSGGVPCSPFSLAGSGLGADDERDLFPVMLDLVATIRPSAVLIENVPGLMRDIFSEYRAQLVSRLEMLGYAAHWSVMSASDFGVAQLRRRVVLVACRIPSQSPFEFPSPPEVPTPTVGELLRSQMAADGWEGADDWAEGANSIAPTLVGGSKKRGGPDLGPTRTKAAWAKLGVNGHTIAPEPPGPGFEGMPRLTVPMAATLQGFPDDWEFAGTKTQTYRQVGNAFPPPMAEAVGRSIESWLRSSGTAEDAA